MEENSIPEELSYHESSDYNVEKKDTLYLVSYIVSLIFTPFMVPFVAFLLIFLFTYLSIMPISYKFSVLMLVYCFTILFPMLGIFIFQKINGWGLKELGKREKRFIPYSLTILSYAACLITMHRIHIPKYMSGIVLAVLICMVVCTIVNLKIKISTHAASSGMMVGGLLSYSFLFQFNPVWWLSGFILLSGMLCSARIILRQHTIAEVFIGFVIGLFCGVTGILFI